MDLHSLCQKLDEVAMSYFEVLEELTERKKRLQEDLREGFFSLSKARYSMGSRSVGSLQYSTNMKALASVQVSESDGSCSFCTDRINPTKKRVIQEGHDQDTSNDHSNDYQVRRRKVKGSATDESSVEEWVQDMSLDDEEYKDPIKWFGILVPAALRQGQSSFIQAVEQAVQVASLQNRLTALQGEYQDLRRLKRELKERKADVEEEENTSLPDDETTG